MHEHYNCYGVIYNCPFYSGVGLANRIPLYIHVMQWYYGDHFVHYIWVWVSFKMWHICYPIHHLIGSQNTEDWNVRCHIISYTTAAHHCIADSFVQFGCFWCVNLMRQQVGKEFLFNLSLFPSYSHEGGRVDSLFCLFKKLSPLI